MKALFPVEEKAAAPKRKKKAAAPKQDPLPTYDIVLLLEGHPSTIRGCLTHRAAEHEGSVATYAYIALLEHRAKSLALSQSEENKAELALLNPLLNFYNKPTVQSGPRLV
jgi:hypothetical protein